MKSTEDRERGTYVFAVVELLNAVCSSRVTVSVRRNLMQSLTITSVKMP